MSDNTGKFVWYEWMGADLPGAVTFYRHVVGWEIAETGMAGFPYHIASIGGYGVAGLLTTPPPAQGTPPCWTGYIYVDNVDAGAAKLKEAGGHALRDPMDIPNVGRMAVVSDPQGAPFALFKDAGGNPPPAPPPETAGLVGWRELHARDGATAFDFYASQFGWKKRDEFDMGPMGVYRIFENHDGQAGGMMSMSPPSGPCWLYYFLVEGAAAAAARVKDKGGKVLNGPHEVPGGMFALQCADPEGAMFGLVAAKP